MRSFSNKNTTLNVNPFNGGLDVTVSDMTFPGKGMNIALTRYFNSLFIYATSRPYGYFAQGWTFDFHEYLYFDEDDGSVTFYNSTMTQAYRFFRTNGSYSPYGADNKLQLVDNKNGTMTITYLSGLKKIFDSSMGYLLRIRDTIGNEIQYLWDDSSGETRITQIIDTSGRMLNFSYDVQTSLLRIITVTDWANRTFIYTTTRPDADGLWVLESYTDPMGNVTSYTYHQSLALLKSISFPKGLWVQTTQLGPRPDETRVKDLYFSSGLSVHYSYDWDNRATTVTTGDRTYVYEYNVAGELVISTDPLDNVFSYTHDSAHRLLTVTDPRMGIQSYTYDSATGNLITATDQLDNTTTYEYTDTNWPTKVTKLTGPEPFSYETLFSYDPVTGNLLTITDDEDKTTLRTYYDSGYRKGLIHTFTDTNNNTVTYDYGYFGELASTTNSLNKVTQFKYDISGNLIETINPLGDVTKRIFDKNNRVISTTDALGNISRSEYDENGLLISKTDPLNRTTRFFHDIYGRHIKTQDSLGNCVEYDYNKFGYNTGKTDACGHRTEFSYDIQDRLIEVKDPLGRKTTFSYDPYCNKSIKTDPEGKTITKFMNSVCRLYKIEYHDGSFILFTFDELGRTTSMTNPGPVYGGFDYGGEKYGYDPDNSFTYEYDTLNRLTKINFPGGKSISYEFDDVGNLTKLTDINSESTDYEYNDNNRLAKVTNGGVDVTYTYNDGGQLINMTLPNGITCDYSYDSDGQITQILYKKSVSTICDIQYKYDKSGNKIQKSIEMPPSSAIVENYSYDAEYRLVQVMKDNTLFRAYIYDPVGNRLSKRTASNLVDYGYDACDEMNYAGEVSFRYDLKGRLIAVYDPADDTERTYVWDYADRLRYTNYPDSTTSEMRYDSEGLRTYRKDKDGNITNYYWSPHLMKNVLNETDGTGAAKASYIIGQNLIAIKVSGVKKYYIKDALESVIALTDESGNVTDTYEYNDFGELISSTGSSYNPYRYTGQQYDSDSELYYLRARYYEPSTGRFISRDPVFTSTGNLYVYSQNNPINSADPSGKDFKDDIPTFMDQIKETVPNNSLTKSNCLGFAYYVLRLGKDDRGQNLDLYNTMLDNYSYNLILKEMELCGYDMNGVELSADSNIPLEKFDILIWNAPDPSTDEISKEFHIAIVSEGNEIPLNAEVSHVMGANSYFFRQGLGGMLGLNQFLGGSLGKCKFKRYRLKGK
jgi:RHS repeat-associated protein